MNGDWTCGDHENIKSIIAVVVVGASSHRKYVQSGYDDDIRRGRII